MSETSRYYGSGTEKALFMLSRGTCYEPTCKEPVLKMTNSGTPRVNVQIAHIRSLAVGEARYEAAYPKKDLNRFQNLILLCPAHHSEVDSDLWEELYQADVLLGWKSDVEQGGLGSALESIPPLMSEDDLQDAFVEAIEGARLEIIRAIDELAGISKDTANMVKTLVTESFNRPYISKDQADSLEYAARVFSTLEGQTLMLHDAANKIQGVEEYGYLLADSADTFRTFPDYLPALVSAAEAIRLLPDYIGPLGDAAENIENSRRSLVDLQDTVSLMVDMDVNGKISSPAHKVECAVDRFVSAAGGLHRIQDTESMISAVSENLSRIEEFVGNANRSNNPIQWNVFWWGFCVCFAAIIILLGLWSYATN